MPQTIAIDLVGNSSEFVAACRAALGAEMKLEQQSKKVKDALNKQNRASDQATGGLNKQKGAAAGVKNEMGLLGGVLRSGAGAVSGFMAAWVGIEGIRKAWAFVKDEIRQVVDAQKKLGSSGRVMDDAAKALANQVGNISVDQAEQRLADIMKAGRLKNVGQAESVAIAANVVWGGLGEEKEKEMAALAAEFIGRKGLGEAEGGALIEVLGKLGVNDPEVAKQQMERVFVAFRQSQATSASAFVTGLAKAAPEMAAAGASSELILASATRARDVKATSEEAAQLNRQILMALNKPEVQKGMAKQAGMSREDWMSQGFDERYMQFGQWVSKSGETAKGQMLLQDVLSGEQLGRTMAMFSPEGLQKMQEYQDNILAVTAETYNQAAVDYAKTGISQREAMETEKELGELRVSNILKTGEAARQKYQGDVTRIKAGEDVEGLTEKQERRARAEFRYTFAGNEAGVVAREAYRKEIGQLLRTAEGRGDIVEAPVTAGEDMHQARWLANTERGRKLVQLENMWQAMGEGVDSPRDMGEMIVLMRDVADNTGGTKEAIETQANAQPLYQ